MRDAARHSTSLRVLYLHEFGRVGGAELALLRLIEAIAPLGVTPVIAWPRREAAVQRLIAGGIRVVRLRVPRWRHGLSRCLRRGPQRARHA